MPLLSISGCTSWTFHNVENRVCVDEKEDERYHKNRFPSICYTAEWFISVNVMLCVLISLWDSYPVNSNYFNHPKMTQKNHIKFCLTCNTAVLYYTRGWAVSDVIPALPFICMVFLNVWHLYAVSGELLLMSQSYKFRFPFFSLFKSMCRNNEEENLLLASPSNWQNENLS